MAPEVVDPPWSHMIDLRQPTVTGAPQEIDPELKRIQEMLQEVG